MVAIYSVDGPLSGDWRHPYAWPGFGDHPEACLLLFLSVPLRAFHCVLCALQKEWMISHAPQQCLLTRTIDIHAVKS